MAEDSPNRRAAKVKVDLEYPFTWEGVERDSVEFRRIKGSDIRKLGNDDTVDGSFALMAKLSGESPEFFDEMDGVDLDACGEVIEGFTKKSGRRRAKT